MRSSRTFDRVYFAPTPPPSSPLLLSPSSTPPSSSLLSPLLPPPPPSPTSLLLSPPLTLALTLAPHLDVPPHERLLDDVIQCGPLVGVSSKDLVDRVTEIGAVTVINGVIPVVVVVVVVVVVLSE